MATIRIGNTVSGILQPEQPIHMNPDGSGQASLTWKMDEGSGDAILPAYGTPHPRFPELQCFESDIDREPGGIIRISAIYKGVLIEDIELLGQHEGTRTVMEAPVETHPIFSLPRDNPPVTPSDIAGIELRLQNCEPEDPAWSPIVKLLFNKKRRGIESYLKIGMTYRKSYCQSDIPSSGLLDTAGKIINPPSPCPSPPSDQEYMCMGISWQKQAGVVTVSEEYQLSGPGGWDPDLYPQSS